MGKLTKIGFGLGIVGLSAVTAQAETPQSTNEMAQHDDTTNNVQSVTPNQGAMDKAVEAAQAAGVDVEVGLPRDLGTAQTEPEAKIKDAEATQHMQDQVTKVQEATAEQISKNEVYETQKRAYAADAANYGENKKAYDAEKAKYDVAKAAYDKEKATFDVANVKYTADKTKYDADKAQYDTDKAAYDTNKAQYDTAKAKYDTDKATYDTAARKYTAAKAEYDTKKAAYDEAEATRQENLAKAKSQPELSQGGGIKLHGKVDPTGANTDLTAYKGNANLAKYYRDFYAVTNEKVTAIKGKIGPHADSRITVETPDKVQWLSTKTDKQPEVTPDSELYYYEVQKGAKFKINHIGQDIAGRQIDLELTLMEDLGKQDERTKHLPTYITMGLYDKGKPSSSVYFTLSNGDHATFHYKFTYADNGQPAVFAQSIVSADVDYAQGVGVKFDKDNTSAYYNDPKSHLKLTKDPKYGVVAQSEPFELDGYPKDFWNENADKTAPSGTIVHAGVGDFTYTFFMGSTHTLPNEHFTQANRDGDVTNMLASETFKQGWGHGGAWGLFGLQAVPTVAEDPYPAPEAPKAPTAPKEPTAPTPPTAPVAPVAPVAPKAPVAPTPPKDPSAVPPAPAPTKVTVHPVFYSVKPELVKTVQDETGADINKKTVAVQSDVVYKLKVGSLPYGRAVHTSVEVVDDLPTYFKGDQDKIVKENPNWDVKFEENNRVRFTYKNLDQINADRNKPFTLGNITILGQVLRDELVYDNVFKTVIDNTYTKYSNKVTVTTPDKPNPIKHNTNKDGQIIDDAVTLAKSTNYYELEWDLDQYRDINFSRKDVDRGFAFFDDYPDEALTPVEGGTVVEKATGEAVKGLKFETYKADELDKVPAHIQKLMESSGFKPKGSFHVWYPEDNQAFFDNYVKTGKTLTIRDAFTVLAGEKTYINQALQVDFGNGYRSNVVTNHVPNLVNEKTVTVDDKAVDVVDPGTGFQYHLKGTIVPANRSEKLTQ